MRTQEKCANFISVLSDNSISTSRRHLKETLFHELVFWKGFPTLNATCGHLLRKRLVVSRILASKLSKFLVLKELPLHVICADNTVESRPHRRAWKEDRCD